QEPHRGGVRGRERGMRGRGAHRLAEPARAVLRPAAIDDQPPARGGELEGEAARVRVDGEAAGGRAADVEDQRGAAAGDAVIAAVGRELEGLPARLVAREERFDEPAVALAA